MNEVIKQLLISSILSSVACIHLIFVMIRVNVNVIVKSTCKSDAMSLRVPSLRSILRVLRKCHVSTSMSMSSQVAYSNTIFHGSTAGRKR